MPARIFDGKRLAGKYLEEIKDYIYENGIMPRLATILAGNDEASLAYVKIKRKTCKAAGIDVELHRPADKQEILELIGDMNSDKSVNGILVQLPLPQMDEVEILSAIEPAKDVDGLHPYNIGRLAYGDETMPACTPFGIVKILEHENIAAGGSRAAIIGRGIHVGKPLYSMLANRNATVTLCHSRTRNLTDITAEADIVIVAVGRPDFLTQDMIKEGAAIIDVGMNRRGGKLVGDADFSVRNRASFITPVPGGVGPMTVAMLARNMLNAHKIQNKLSGVR